MACILIIDDEEPIRDILSIRVEDLKHEALTAETLAQGLEMVDQQAPDLVFLDVNLPDGSGLEVLTVIKESAGNPEVIIITAAGSSHGAELAINSGAWDYIEKPFYKDALILQIQRALEYRATRQRQGSRLLLETGGIIGRSSAIKSSLEQVAQSSSSLVNVLIQGESGTGKELFARAIHDNSRLNRGEYIVVDCAAMPETLIETLLFGHKKGAFTGADKESEGLVKMADQGTLFLDEIGELPLSAQKIFLRVLQEKRFRPVGSPVEIKSNFRLISATNRDLDAMAKNGTFRQDLLHRLKTFVIDLPPLRDRKNDISDLAVHYTNHLCTQHNLPRKVLLPDTLMTLESYDWPGNVRELINVLEKAMLSDPEIPLIYPMHLPSHIRVMHVKKGLQGTAGFMEDASVERPRSTPSFLPSFKVFRTHALEQIEGDYFHRLLAETGWDLDQAAERSGLSKNRIYFFIRKHQLRKV